MSKINFNYAFFIRNNDIYRQRLKNKFDSQKIENELKAQLDENGNLQFGDDNVMIILSSLNVKNGDADEEFNRIDLDIKAEDMSDSIIDGSFASSINELFLSLSEELNSIFCQADVVKLSTCLENNEYVEFLKGSPADVSCIRNVVSKYKFIVRCSCSLYQYINEFIKAFDKFEVNSLDEKDGTTIYLKFEERVHADEYVNKISKIHDEIVSSKYFQKLLEYSNVELSEYKDKQLVGTFTWNKKKKDENVNEKDLFMTSASETYMEMPVSSMSDNPHWKYFSGYLDTWRSILNFIGLIIFIFSILSGFGITEGSVLVIILSSVLGFFIALPFWFSAFIIKLTVEGIGAICYSQYVQRRIVKKQ